MLLCENCSTQHDGSFASGRFCNKICSRSFATKNKRKEINERVSKTLKTTKPARNVELICEFCEKKFVRCYNNRDQKCCSRSCSTKLNWTKKEYSESIINLTKERVKNGTHKGWASRNVLSYPEKFFKKVLDENGWEGRYQINFPIKKADLGLDCSSNYFLDFYFDEFKLDLEIDGKQHKYPERQKSDKIRDFVLNENGIKVHRIDWNQINDEPGKQLIQQKINELLEMLSLLSRCSSIW